MKIFWPLGGVLLVCWTAASAGAQVTIRVVDAAERPVPAVRIDVVGAGELLGVYSTTAEGVAELGPERLSEARRISLSHLGFQTLIVQVGDIPADGLLRLEPEATPIEGLTVEAPGLCPVADEPEARRLWSDVASLYAADTGSRAWLAYMSIYGGSVREDLLHRTSDVGTVAYVVAGGPGSIHGTDHTSRPFDDRIAAEGYAWPPLVIGGTTGGRELAWRYPELDRSRAHHFASPVFGALHDFAVASLSDEETTLAFCANGQGRGATIDGTITLVPGVGFVAATWRFQTDDPDEGAGGSVRFASQVQGQGSKPHLVASRGYFFRHDGIEPPYPDLPRTYSRWGTASARWYLLPTASRPCNAGISYYLDPPSPRDPAGLRFAACVAEHWGRE